MGQLLHGLILEWGHGWVSAWDPLAEAQARPQCSPWGSLSGWAGARLLWGAASRLQGRGTEPLESLCSGVLLRVTCDGSTPCPQPGRT